MSVYLCHPQPSFLLPACRKSNVETCLLVCFCLMHRHRHGLESSFADMIDLEIFRKYIKVRIRCYNYSYSILHSCTDFVKRSNVRSMKPDPKKPDLTISALGEGKLISAEMIEKIRFRLGRCVVISFKLTALHSSFKNQD